MTEFNFGAMLSQENQVKQIPLDMLVPYQNHQFTLYDGERRDDMVESIKQNGVITPIMCRPFGDKYEILIGHNRWNCSKLAGLEYIPAIIKENLTDEEAEIYVTESNLIQRGFNDLKISEQAKVIAIHYSEMFSQGKRNDIINELRALSGEKDTSAPQGQKSSSREQLGEEYGLSRNTVARLIRISKLVKPLQDWVDKKTVSIRAAVELSYLDEGVQETLYKLNTFNPTPDTCEIIYKISEAQAKQLRAALDGAEPNHPNTRQIIVNILKGKEKKKSSEKSIKINTDTFERYFTQKSAEEISDIIETALQMYFRQQNESEDLK